MSSHNHCFSHHHYQAWCHQIFFVNNTKIFVTPSVLKLQKWFLHQNGVEFNKKSKSDDPGALYKVTWRCLAVPELPKALLKMASGLISPIGHCRQLCNEWFGASYMEYCVFLVVSMSTLLHPSPHIPPVRHRYPNIAIITRPGSRHNLLLCLQPSRIQSQ